MPEPSVMAAIKRWSTQGRRIVAASIVDTVGSTPHLRGLALVVNDAGEIAGAISGGCVDGEIVSACDEVLATGKPRSIRFGKEDTIFGASGLACGGEIVVWFYQLSSETIAALSVAPPGQLALSTVWTGDGDRLEQLVMDQQKAAAVMKCCGTNDIPVSYNSAQRAANFLLYSKERICLAKLSGGETEFVERIGHREVALVIGESGFTDAICRQARLLDYEVIVCEPRPRFASSIVSADEVDGNWPDICINKLMASSRLGPGSAIIVCTHDKKFDEPAFLAALQSQSGFIGALGSRRTIEERRSRLLARGLTEAEISRIKSPAGLDLGSETPAETAVSIFAEIIATVRGRSKKPLTELRGSIHDGKLCHK